MRISNKIAKNLTYEDWNNFDELYLNWKKDTFLFSNPDQIINSKYYRYIKYNGIKYVPFVLYKMSVSPSYWFTLLDEIITDKPLFLPQDSGNIELMTTRWLCFGIKSNLLEFNLSDNEDLKAKILNVELNCEVQPTKYVHIFKLLNSI